tara:strand:+ start:131 stop:409 length:279 start_codon:yes stop_codon:yes gene_type:complete
MHSKKNKERSLMKKYFKIPSALIGVGIGYINYYFLFHLWEISWEISFVIAFILGYLAGNAIDIYAGKISQAELDAKKALEISDTANSFEKNG